MTRTAAAALAGLIALSGAPDSRAEPAADPAALPTAAPAAEPAADPAALPAAAPTAPRPPRCRAARAGCRPLELRLRTLPFAPRLTMRAATPHPTRTARAPDPAGAGPATPADPPEPSPAADGAATPPAADPLVFEPVGPSVPGTVEDREPGLVRLVRARLQLGLAVDGAAPSELARTVAGQTLGDPSVQQMIGYARARAYAWGDAAIGVRDVGVAGVSTYLASQFRVAPGVPEFAPVPSAWDGSDPIQVRAGWAEADGVFDSGPLSTLFVRGGRQYVYGPATAHLDGLFGSWKRAWFSAALYLGTRVPDWFERDPRYPDIGPPRGVIVGGELGLDLRRFHLPFTFRLRSLAYDQHGHSDLTIDWRASDDLVTSLWSRLFDGAVAREHATVRYRLSEETRLVFDADYRHRRDPIWDYAFRDGDDASAARRYLDLGPRVPRAQARIRAGTVLLDNIDVLIHGGVALDARLEPDEVSYRAAGWLEGGAAIEVRVRRTFALGLSGLSRTYRHRDADPPVIDAEDEVADLTLPPDNVGERNLVEGGVVARFSGGARRFSAAAEVYVRRTRWVELYVDDGMVDGLGDDIEDQRVLEPIDLRGGGRLTLDGWINPNLRMRAEYELSSAIDAAPEVLGLKALRVVAEGTF